MILMISNIYDIYKKMYLLGNDHVNFKGWGCAICCFLIFVTKFIKKRHLYLKDEKIII
jgi:hypothetical protein